MEAKTQTPQDQDANRVVLMEDDEAVRLLLVRVLRNMGCRVVGCESGDEGLAHLEREGADIVITDIRMEGTSGMEVLRQVRDRWPEIEVVLITGYATVEFAIEALRHGAYDMLLKPVNIEEIGPVIERCRARLSRARENRELRRAVDRLLELNSRKEKFVALANHELRTPTAVAAGLLGMLAKQVDQLPDEAAALVVKAREAVDRMSDVVDDLGTLALARTDEQWVKPDDCRICEIAEELGLLCEGYSQLRDLKIELVNQIMNGARITADKPKLVRAVGALLQNAVKFTPDGGQIEARVGRSGKMVQFSVSDSGVGVPEEESEKIFDPFYRVGDHQNHHSSPHEFGGGGLGVGLSIARDIARAHGGDLKYRPRSGGGSTFVLSVPAG